MKNFTNRLLLLISLFFVFFIFDLNLIYSSQEDNSNQKNLFLNDCLSKLSQIYSISDTWFDRYYIFRQSPYNSYSIIYNDVPLNNILDGSFSNNLFLLSNSEYQTKQQSIDIFTNTNSLLNGVNISDTDIDSNLINLKIQGGNIFGNSAFILRNKSDNLYWTTKINYITSSGYDISRKKNDSISLSRSNSANEQLSVNFKFGIFDNKSSISLEYNFSQINQQFPYSLRKNEQIYLREPNTKYNFINIKFNTLMNSDLNILGNLYFVRKNTFMERFDNNEFNSMNLETSFKKYFDESKYGINSSIEFTEGILPPGIIALNYNRENIKYQNNSEKAINSFSLERLSLGIDFFDTTSVLSYDFSIYYKILNPLTVYMDFELNTYKDYEYSFLLKLAIYKNLKIHSLLSRNIMLPLPYLIYPELNEINLSSNNIENTINQTFEFGMNYTINNKLSLEINYFNSYFDNIQIPYSLINFSIENIESKFNSVGFELALVFNFDIVEIILNTNYYFNNISIFDNLGRELMIPNWNTNLTINKKFDFGLNFSINVKYIYDRKSNIDENFIAKDYCLINLFINQAIWGKNSVYLKINNLLDKYYEIFRNNPMPGIFFVAGINLNF